MHVFQLQRESEQQSRISRLLIDERDNKCANKSRRNSWRAKDDNLHFVVVRLISISELTHDDKLTTYTAAAA